MDPYGRARDLSALLLATRFCLGTEHGEREIAGVSCYVSHRALIRPQVVNGPLSVLVMDREDDVNSIWTPARLVNLAWDLELLESRIVFRGEVDHKLGRQGSVFDRTGNHHHRRTVGLYCRSPESNLVAACNERCLLANHIEG